MRAAVIGGGIGGMTTALLLSQSGFSVTIYEKAPKLGGRLAYQEGGGYRIDQGPTIVLLPEMLLEVLAECGIGSEELELLPCDPLYAIHYADGDVLHKRRHPADQAAELRKAGFSGEEQGFARYMRDMEGMYRAGKKAFLEQSFLRKRDFFTVRNMSLLAKVRAHRSVRDIAARYFRSDKLRDAFSLQTLYIGGAPFQAPGLYTLLPYAEHAFGVWYLKGGYAGLAVRMEEELRRRGVDVLLKQPVDKLLITSGVCEGVSSGGQETLYDAVVYNGDFPGIEELLPAAGQGQGKTSRKQASYVPSSGCLLIYLGADRRWPEAQMHQFFLPSSLQGSLRELFEQGKIPDEPSFYIFNPCHMDETAAPEGKSVLYMLVPVPSGQEIDWSQAAQPLAESIIDQAEARGFPGLRASIQWMELRTPEDARRDGLYQGGSFGIAPILSQSAVYRPQVVPYPIAGLYAVGASLHPGGGIPIVMQGARLAANQIVKEMKSWSSKPRSRDASR